MLVCSGVWIWCSSLPSHHFLLHITSSSSPSHHSLLLIIATSSSSSSSPLHTEPPLPSVKISAFFYLYLANSTQSLVHLYEVSRQPGSILSQTQCSLSCRLCNIQFNNNAAIFRISLDFDGLIQRWRYDYMRYWSIPT